MNRSTERVKTPLHQYGARSLPGTPKCPIGCPNAPELPTSDGGQARSRGLLVELLEHEGDLELGVAGVQQPAQGLLDLAQAPLHRVPVDFQRGGGGRRVESGVEVGAQRLAQAKAG